MEDYDGFIYIHTSPWQLYCIFLFVLVAIHVYKRYTPSKGREIKPY